MTPGRGTAWFPWAGLRWDDLAAARRFRARLSAGLRLSAPIRANRALAPFQDVSRSSRCAFASLNIQVAAHSCAFKLPRLQAATCLSAACSNRYICGSGMLRFWHAAVLACSDSLTFPFPSVQVVACSVRCAFRSSCIHILAPPDSRSFRSLRIQLPADADPCTLKSFPEAVKKEPPEISGGVRVSVFAPLFSSSRRGHPAAHTAIEAGRSFPGQYSSVFRRRGNRFTSGKGGCTKARIPVPISSEPARH